MKLVRTFLLCFVCYFSMIAYAYAGFEELVLDKVKQFSKELSFSEQFIEALSKCSSFVEKRQEISVEDTYKIKGFDTEDSFFVEKRQGMGNEVVYEIKGVDEDGRCLLEASSQDDVAAVKTLCKFDNEDLEQFTESQKAIKKLVFEATSIKEIIENENYRVAQRMMLDEEKCSHRRLATDPTKELRQKLEKCEPYVATIESDGRQEVTAKIVGMHDDLCQYVLHTKRIAPSAEEMKKLWGDEGYDKMKAYIKDMSMTIECKFNEQARKEYIRLLAKTVIPEGDAYDFEFLEDLQRVKNELSNFFDSQGCKGFIK